MAGGNSLINLGEKETFNNPARNQFKSRALARLDVRKAYDDLAEEFVFLDEVRLKEVKDAYA